MSDQENRVMELAVNIPIPADMSEEDKADWIRMGLATLKVMDTVQELSLSNKAFAEAFLKKDMAALAKEMKNYISAFHYLEKLRNKMRQRKKERDERLTKSKSV